MTLRKFHVADPDYKAHFLSLEGRQRKERGFGLVPTAISELQIWREGWLYRRHRLQL